MTHRIATILVDRANYGRLRPVMEAIESDPELKQSVFCGGSTVVPGHGDLVNNLPGFHTHALLPVRSSMYESVGSHTRSFGMECQLLKPAAVLIIGDRHEAMGAACAAYYQRIPILHLQGGEVSGTLDDGTRRAITQLATWHVPATIEAGLRLQHQGVRPSDILCIGCPSSDTAKQFKRRRGERVLVIFHPDTTGTGDCASQLDQVLQGLAGQPIDLWQPNLDQGSEEIRRVVQSHESQEDCDIITNLPPEEFYRRLANAKCCVGNSSSFVRDSGFFGTPCILVGGRQLDRQRSYNVIEVAPHAEAIRRAVQGHGAQEFEPSDLYGDGNVAPRVVAALKKKLTPQTKPQETNSCDSLPLFQPKARACGCRVKT